MGAEPRISTIDLTRSFIDELTVHIDKQYLKNGVPLDRLAIVFGGKRPSLFLKRCLADQIGKAFIPPKIFTIDEFMDHVADQNEKLDAGQELDRSYTLYQLARQVTPELLNGRESFARFLPWAREILDLIEQLDLENVDNKALLSVEENARIGYAVPESINDLLRNIKQLREAFHEELIRRKQTFRGLQYLRAARNVEGYAAEEFDQVLFCNFFYFHKTEEVVVRHLYDTERAELIFQGDQRKWPVLKRIAERFQCRILEGDEPTPTTFDLHLHAGTDVHVEAAIVRELLKKVDDPGRAVVVLPESGHVVPLLSELPEGLEDMNVSMGYSLERSSLASLLGFLMKAQLSRKGERYYARDHLKALRHPFIKDLRVLKDETPLRVLVHKVEDVLTGRITSPISGSSFISLEDILSENLIFTSARTTLANMGIDLKEEDLRQALSEVYARVFQAWEGVHDMAGFACVLGELLDLVTAKSYLRDHPLNINIASRMYDVKEEFERAAFRQELFDFDEIVRIFEDKISRELVHFSGTPLKGLQVLGLFETRSLNFDTVIIMDANEGVLPRLDIRASLVPREVMASLKLDRLELEEEIQRYQFMRIISSARNVHLVYQDRRDKERSRFIEELVWEAEKKVGAPLGVPVQRGSFPVNIAVQERSVPKTPEMLKLLKGMRFSASSLNLYLKDPYEFYTNYVLGLRESEDLLDEPDGRMIGTFLHEVLKEVYTPLLGKPFKVDVDLEKRLWHVFEERFAETFVKVMRSDAFLLKAVIEHRLKIFLEREKESEAAVAEVLFLEQSFEEAVTLTPGPIALRCVVDRVDRLKDGRILLIDYKTGITDKLPKEGFHPGSTLDRESLLKNLSSFQLPIYYYFLSQRFPESAIATELYGLRGAQRQRFPRSATSSHEDFLQPYWQALDLVVTEILDPQIPFIDDDIKKFD